MKPFYGHSRYIYFLAKSYGFIYFELINELLYKLFEVLPTKLLKNNKEIDQYLHVQLKPIMSYLDP